MALPFSLSITSSTPGQTLVGDNSDESFGLISSGGFGEINNFIIRGRGGNDTLTLIGSPVQTNVFGNEGDDLIGVAPDISAIIIDSKFFAGPGNDSVILNNVTFIGTGKGTSQIGMAGGDDLIGLSGSFNNVNLFANDGADGIIFGGSSSFVNSRAFTGDGDDSFFDNGFEVDFTNTELGFKGGRDIVGLQNSITGSGSNGLSVFLGDGDDLFYGPRSGEMELLAGSGDDNIFSGGSSDRLSGKAGADTFWQTQGGSASVASGQMGGALMLNFSSRPDIITDFQTAAGDAIVFDSLGGPSSFVDNRTFATGGFGFNDRVLYSGFFNSANNSFTTTNNNAGPDVLTFLSNGNSGFTSDFGDQAFVLLGASGQGFDTTDFGAINVIIP